MTENMMNFLKAVSEDEALGAKVGQVSDTNEIIAIAKDLGIELTEADFVTAPTEISDDELDAVSGGTSVNCSCALGGGGAKDANDKTCACVVAGFGYSKDGSQRCFCPIAGFGYNY